jgi:hypothetical protein
MVLEGGDDGWYFILSLVASVAPTCRCSVRAIGPEEVGRSCGLGQLGGTDRPVSLIHCS